MHELMITTEDISYSLGVKLQVVLRVLSNSNDNKWAKTLIKKFDTNQGNLNVRSAEIK